LKHLEVFRGSLPRFDTD